MIKDIIEIIIFTAIATFFGLVVGSITANANIVKIGIIDSGFSKTTVSQDIPLCNTGHLDFTNRTRTVGSDDAGHGTIVTYTAYNTIKPKYRLNVCFVIYKFNFNSAYSSIYKDIETIMSSANINKVKIMNLSIGFNYYDFNLHKTFTKFNKNKILLFSASGNENLNSNLVCNSYPMCFKGIKPYVQSIGALNWYDWKRADYSNTGAMVDQWYVGDSLGVSGTSFASPRALGNYINNYFEGLK